jgi:pimeloyl-ACP methyl ester carboxylesterase
MRPWRWTSRAPAAEVSMAGFADDVARRDRAAGLCRAHIVGLSMGGVVALELFARHRDKVRSLTLANTWAFHADAAAAWRGSASRWPR